MSVLKELISKENGAKNLCWFPHPKFRKKGFPSLEAGCNRNKAA
jgi:hypothetical protein